MQYQLAKGRARGARATPMCLERTCDDSRICRVEVTSVGLAYARPITVTTINHGATAAAMQSIGENEDIAQSSDASLSARWTGVVVIANKINSRSADEDGHPAGHANGLAPPAQENITAESTDNDLGSEESSRTRCLLETTLVWTAIVVVWALLTLPIIYYHVDFKRV